MTAARHAVAMEMHPLQMAALAARLRAGEFEAFMRQGEQCAWCRRPIRLRGRQVALDANGRRTTVFSSAFQPDGVVLKGCGNRRETRCPSCARLYRADARHLVKAGLEGGKGVDPAVARHPAVLLTLTAPSFGAVHRTRSGRAPCHPGDPKVRCPHGRRIACFLHHADDEESVSTPICAGCYDYAGQVLHNASTPELWRRTSIYIPRYLAKVLGVTLGELEERLRISFVRVAEFQRRGAVHLHVVVRLDAADGGDPGDFEGALGAACLAAARAVRVCHAGRATTWGDQVDVELLGEREGSRAGRLASYVSKYAVKSSTADGGLDQRIKNDEDLAARRLSPHERRQVATAWHLGAARDRGRLRRYAHSFGYGGHFLTKSRHYSTTFGALRRARAEWRAARRPRCGADVGAIAYELRWRAVGVGWKNRGEAIHAEEQREHYFENKRLAIEALAEERQQLG